MGQHSLKVMTFQPTVSYKFNDVVSIGFGPTINRIDGSLESNLSITQALPDGKVKIKGDDTALGFNIGVLVQATGGHHVPLMVFTFVAFLQCVVAVIVGRPSKM